MRNAKDELRGRGGPQVPIRRWEFPVHHRGVGRCPIRTRRKRAVLTPSMRGEDRCATTAFEKELGSPSGRASPNLPLLWGGGVFRAAPRAPHDPKRPRASACCSSHQARLAAASPGAPVLAAAAASAAVAAAPEADPRWRSPGADANLRRAMCDGRGAGRDNSRSRGAHLLFVRSAGRGSAS